MSRAAGSQTIRDRLLALAQDAPERPAFTWIETSGPVEDWSYGTLDAEARRIAGAIQRLGPGADGAPDRALLVYAPSLQYVAAFFGCLYAGVIPVPAYPPLSEQGMERLRAIARDADVRFALTPATPEGLVEAVALDAPSFERWLATDDVPDDAAADWRDGGARMEDIAFLQYTSGSTGSPKGVVISHRNIAAQIGALTSRFDMGPQCSVVSWLPPYHDMGLIGCILGAVAWRAPCRLMSPETFLRRPVTWLRAFKGFPLAASPAPNFAYDLCVRKVRDEDLPELDLSSWEVAINGAEPVLAETLDRFAERFAPCGFRARSLRPSYGLAEATLLVAARRYETEPIEVEPFALAEGAAVPAEEGSGTRLVSCGTIVEGHEAVVVDAEGRPLPEDRVGEIMLAGPTIAEGYWDSSRAGPRAFDGRVEGSECRYLPTGDLGFFHEGEIHVTGRLKDVIIVHGRNYYPADIERSIQAADSRLRPGCGVAVQVAAEDGREALAVVHETSATDEDQLDELIETVREAVRREHNLLVDAVVLVPPRSVPKTSSGKVQRLACGAALADDRLEELARWSRVLRFRSRRAPVAGVAGS